MVKKGRHRRYEEARKFNREEFDLDAPDPFALPDVAPTDEEQDERTAALARKYGMVDEDTEGAVEEPEGDVEDGSRPATQNPD